MYRAEVHDFIDERWQSMQPIQVGVPHPGSARPDAYITVTQNGVPFALANAWEDRHSPYVFVGLLCWGRFVVFGWGSHAYLIDPQTRAVITVPCNGYFGHAYPFDQHLLIADADRLICFDIDGNKLWTSDYVGIDGVIVDEVRDGTIYGQGEWDPPGGWRPFRVSLKTGEATLG
jgi:hypothetical protein